VASVAVKPHTRHILNEQAGLNGRSAKERPGNFFGKKSLLWQLCESSCFRWKNFSGNGAQIPLAIF
jgi:hypothetical protein